MYLLSLGFVWVFSSSNIAVLDLKHSLLMLESDPRNVFLPLCNAKCTKLELLLTKCLPNGNQYYLPRFLRMRPLKETSEIFSKNCCSLLVQ